MLSKIKYESKRNQIINNIRDFNNTSDSEGDRHSKRIYTIGFLNHCGYSENEIASIILNYNPSLSSDTARRKFVDPNWIRDNFSGCKKNPIKKKPSLDNAERSSAYSTERSEVIVSSNVEERYNFIPAEDKNKKFFQGANIIAYGYKVDGIEKYNIKGKMYNYNPRTTPYYRSISGSDHVLFVADLDRSNFNNSIEEARLYALELKKFWSWDIIKFSGSEGFHLIKYMPKGTTVKELREIALKIDPSVNKLDWHLFNDLNWKIRGYCVNWKTGNMSQDIDLETFRGKEK